jgi:hypothetical protein
VCIPPGEVLEGDWRPARELLDVVWIETVNEVEKLGVKTIIAGHTDPAAPDNDAVRLIEATRPYIYDFDEAVASSSRCEEVVSKMTAKYPDLGNPYTLWLASTTQPYGD